MIESDIRNLTRMGLGQASRFYGLTPRALRFYEQVGLVDSRRDRLNVRSYEGPARRRLSWISTLRKAGVTLRRIQAALEAEDEESGRGMKMALNHLLARRKAVLDDLAQVDAVLAAWKVASQNAGSARQVELALDAERAKLGCRIEHRDLSAEAAQDLGT